MTQFWLFLVALFVAMWAFYLSFRILERITLWSFLRFMGIGAVTIFVAGCVARYSNSYPVSAGLAFGMLIAFWLGLYTLAKFLERKKVSSPKAILVLGIILSVVAPLNALASRSKEAATRRTYAASLDDSEITFSTSGPEDKQIDLHIYRVQPDRLGEPLTTVECSDVIDGLRQDPEFAKTLEPFGFNSVTCNGGNPVPIIKAPARKPYSLPAHKERQELS